MYEYTGIIGDIEIVKKFKEYLEATSGKHPTDSVQNAAVLGT
jgi:hypothetical protein